MGYLYNLPPFRLESSDISFSDWISIITLSLAPLLAHIVAGVSEPVALCGDEPKWYDHISHYNPTSILWRYAAITDRRIRACAWDKGTLAATNALFWTSKGWDGSEGMVTRALPFCVRLPRRARLKIFSWETIKTIITTMQGLQVIANGLSNFYGPNSLTLGFGVDVVFYPLAILGLLRLFAAFWLADDYAFTEHQVVPTKTHPLDAQRASIDSLLETRSIANLSTSQFRPSSWASRLFLIFYVLFLQGFLGILFFYASREYQTVTSLIFYLVYQIILAVSILLFTYYFIRGLNSTTIIPCISSWWYKAYSVILMGSMVALVTVACIQTRRTPCGKYTSSPDIYADGVLCETKDSLLISVGDEADRSVFGLASHPPNQTILRENEFWVDSFTGSCMGHWSDNPRIHALVVDILSIMEGKSTHWGNETN
ncbi:hypothetical protein F4776DRAFT_180592 [Hypoxylon sp. NC0597]|nr:hypothetical protein F4776DRAFT_180592 [Hypoxylon sp. NC0597]